MKNLPGLKSWSKIHNSQMNPNISASKINLFNADLPMFIMNYGIGQRSSSSPASVRGIVIEDAVASVLQGRRTVDEAIIKACERFVQVFYALQNDSHKQYCLIKPMIELACEALKDYGIPIFNPDGTQEKIEFILSHDNWEIPVVGYLDFVFENVIVDLKTTTRCPSVMSLAHQNQRAIYQTAKPNHKLEFLYVTSKKYQFLADGDPKSLMDNIKGTVKKMDTFCKFLTPQDAARAIPINVDSFYWREEIALQRLYNNQTKTKTLEKMEL